MDPILQRIEETVRECFNVLCSKVDALEARISTTQEAASTLKRTWFTPSEVAVMFVKQPYTVREWCRLGRIAARKRASGRGDAQEWEISAEEVDRYREHGLLPVPTEY